MQPPRFEIRHAPAAGGATSDGTRVPASSGWGWVVAAITAGTILGSAIFAAAL
jgi:hypothetical protein